MEVMNIFAAGQETGPENMNNSNSIKSPANLHLMKQENFGTLQFCGNARIQLWYILV
jgi:hypothetical protein